jgi:hypothetical protein
MRNEPDQHDLTEALALAVADAVRARRGAIEAGGPGALHAITVEIEPANRAQVLTVQTYLSWRRVVREATR